MTMYLKAFLHVHGLITKNDINSHRNALRFKTRDGYSHVPHQTTSFDPPHTQPHGSIRLNLNSHMRYGCNLDKDSYLSSGVAFEGCELRTINISNAFS